MSLAVKLLIALLFAALGLLMLLKPTLLWKLQFWATASKDSRPSAFFTICMRIAGILFLAMGIVFGVASLLNH